MVVCVLMASLILLLFFSAAFRPGAKLTGDDALALPGFKVSLKARIEHDGPVFLNPDVENIKVQFAISESPHDRFPADPNGPFDSITKLIGDAVSKEDGSCEVTFQAPALPGNYLVRIQVLEPEKLVLPQLESYLVLSVTAHDTPIVISDIDNTIAQTDVSHSLEDDQVHTPAPLVGASDALIEISSRARVIYLTARPEALTHSSKKWLAENGFPSGPVIHRDVKGEYYKRRFTEWDFKSDYIKTQIIARSWSQVLWGVGHLEGDQVAYRENKISSILIQPKDPKIAEKSKKAYSVNNWAEAKELILNGIPDKLLPEKLEVRD